jgi:hypothetical protein
MKDGVSDGGDMLRHGQKLSSRQTDGGNTMQVNVLGSIEKNPRTGTTGPRVFLIVNVLSSFLE